MRRLWLFIRIVFRNWNGAFLWPLLAWEVATIIHPKEPKT